MFSWALHTPRSSGSVPTSTCCPQVKPCDLPTVMMLASPSPVNSSLKPSPCSQLTPKKSFYPSGPVGSIRPQHTLSLPSFKTPKFWCKHQSQSKVLASWAHLFVSSFPSLLGGLKGSTICSQIFLSLSPGLLKPHLIELRLFVATSSLVATWKSRSE